MRQALVIIDVQNDYFSGGKLPLEHPERALNNINQLEEVFQKNKRPIIYIQHIKKTTPANFFEEGTPGVALHSGLYIKNDSVIIEKEYPNSFYHTALMDYLKQNRVEQLIITGMMTHMCVDSTTRAAKEFGFSPILISDATATKGLMIDDEQVSAQNVQLSFLAALENFAIVQTTQDYLNNI